MLASASLNPPVAQGDYQSVLIWLSGIVLAIALAGCATTRSTNAGSTVPQRPFNGFVLAHSYVDSLKIDGKDVRQKIEFGFDYDRGQVIKRSYAEDGTALGEEVLAAQTLSANDTEQAFAFQLAREHPKLRALLAPADVKMYGGFAYQEHNDPNCGLRTRCVHVFGFVEQGNRTVVHAIVDLMTSRVVDPEFGAGAEVEGTERSLPRETSK